MLGAAYSCHVDSLADKGWAQNVGRGIGKSALELKNFLGAVVEPPLVKEHTLNVQGAVTGVRQVVRADALNEEVLVVLEGVLFVTEV